MAVIRPYGLGGGLFTRVGRGGGVPDAQTRWVVRFHGSPRFYVSLSEVEMAASPGGPNLCTGGTALGDWGAIPFDGNTVTEAWRGPGDEVSLGYEFASPVAIKQVRIRAGQTLNEVPYGFTVLSSDDGVTWIVRHIETAIPAWTMVETKSFTLADERPVVGLGRSNARAWRIRFNSTSIYSGFANIAFAATAGGPTLCTGGGFCCRSGQQSARYISFAFDGSPTTTWWACDGSGVEGRGGYVLLNGFGTVAQVRLTSGTGDFIYTPTAFYVDWSEDVVNWTQALSVSGLAAWTAGLQRDFAIP